MRNRLDLKALCTMLKVTGVNIKVGPRSDYPGCIQFVDLAWWYRGEAGRVMKSRLELVKKRIFRPKSANLGMVGREAPRAAPWAIWDDPGLYGYLQGVIYTVVGLAEGEY